MERYSNFNDAMKMLDENYNKYMENTERMEQNKRKCNCPLPKPDKCITDIMESVALVEAALAHILNAEGEKLQKAVSLACSIDDLLKINESIHTTLTHATFLEQSLYLKLKVIAKDPDKSV